jgi:hypothetical protein
MFSILSILGQTARLFCRQQVYIVNQCPALHKPDWKTRSESVCCAFATTKTYSAWTSNLARSVLSKCFVPGATQILAVQTPCLVTEDSTDLGARGGTRNTNLMCPYFRPLTIFVIRLETKQLQKAKNSQGKWHLILWRILWTNVNYYSTAHKRIVAVAAFQKRPIARSISQ